MRVVKVVLVAVVVVCALGAAPAFGALTYPFDGQLAPVGGSFGDNDEAGNLTVAVDDVNGDTYVADSASGEVDVFETSSGTQLKGLEGSLTPAESFGKGHVEVAANNGTGKVYVLDSTHDVVDVFEPSGGYVCQITGSVTPSASECNGGAGSATPAGGFNNPGGIAVDQATGRVFVVDANNGVVDVFGVGGAYVGQLVLPGGFEARYTRGIAVDDFNGDVYVAESGPEVVYVFNAAGEYETTWTGANTPGGHFSGFVSVAADNASGKVYVTASSQGVDVFEPSGEYVQGRFGQSFGHAAGVAVDQASGRVDVYDDASGVVDILGPGLVLPDVATGTAGALGPRSATLHGVVNPDGVQLTDCHFEYGTSTAYGQNAPCAPATGAIPADSSDHAVTAALTGLAVGTTYHFRLVAANANGANTGSDATFATLPPPTITAADATGLTATSADLNAQIDPNSTDTTYHFEWGTSTAYGTSVPALDADIGAGTSAVAVTTRLSGLSANTTYHWRVIASNPSGTTTGVDHTFVYSTTGEGLPDNRAYEMVTPPQKNAALIGKTAFGVHSDFSRDGSRLILSSIQCFAGSGSCTGNRQSEGEPFDFTRTPTGWVTTAMAPPATRFGDNSEAEVSAEMGAALFYMEAVPGGPEDWWARGSDGSFLDIGPTVPNEGSGSGFTSFAGLALAATSDFSHIVWQSHPVWPFDLTIRGPSVNAAYEYVGAGSAAPVLVGVSGGHGSTDLISTCGTEFSTGTNDIPEALSADGSTVFFTAWACSSGSGVNAGVAVPAREVWARIDESRSVLLSGRSPAGCTSAACLGSPTGDAQFEGASVDGSRMFFASTQQLTDNASEDSHSHDSAYRAEGCRVTSGVNGCNLYEYDFARGVEHNPVAVSAGDSSGGGPRVQGVVAVSPDGSHVYFVAKGVLSGAANSEGRSASDGADNLYVFEHDAAFPEGHTAFVATLPETDFEVWEWINSPRANVTPDGRFLVFASHGALTADDTSGSGAAQVFRYDAQSGVLARVSIGDEGFNDNGNHSEGVPCASSSCAGDAGIAEPDPNVAGTLRLDPTMSDDGSYVFFVSPVALTPGALDMVQIGTDQEDNPVYARNVYEYHEGRVYLTSDGKDTREYANASDVTLLGSDVRGGNVFFTTSDPLVAQDTDTQLDVYDARVCTASEPCVEAAAPVVACQGEGCRGAPPAAPVAPVASSVTFAGSGNLAAPPVVAPKKATVKKKHVKHKRRKKPTKRKRSHKAARSTHRGRGGRS